LGLLFLKKNPTNPIALLILVRYRDYRFEAGGRRQEAGRSAPHYSEKGCNV
jgi:hypothetical protein